MRKYSTDTFSRGELPPLNPVALCEKYGLGRPFAEVSYLEDSPWYYDVDPNPSGPDLPAWIDWNRDGEFEDGSDEADCDVSVSVRGAAATHGPGGFRFHDYVPSPDPQPSPWIPPKGNIVDEYAVGSWPVRPRLARIGAGSGSRLYLFWARGGPQLVYRYTPSKFDECSFAPYSSGLWDVCHEWSEASYRNEMNGFNNFAARRFAVVDPENADSIVIVYALSDQLYWRQLKIDDEPAPLTERWTDPQPLPGTAAANVETVAGADMIVADDPDTGTPMLWLVYVGPNEELYYNRLGPDGVWETEQPVLSSGGFPVTVWASDFWTEGLGVGLAKDADGTVWLAYPGEEFGLGTSRLFFRTFDGATGTWPAASMPGGDELWTTKAPAFLWTPDDPEAASPGRFRLVYADAISTTGTIMATTDEGTTWVWNAWFHENGATTFDMLYEPGTDNNIRMAYIAGNRLYFQPFVDGIVDAVFSDANDWSGMADGICQCLRGCDDLCDCTRPSLCVVNDLRH
jgi:hypothetical protein